MGAYGTSVILVLAVLCEWESLSFKINTAKNSFSTTAVEVDLVCTAPQLCKRGGLL